MTLSRHPSDLPAVALGKSDLRELEGKLRDVLHQPEIAVVISREGTECEYESLDSMVSDRLSPPIVRCFEIKFNAAGGHGRIAADSSASDDHLLYIDGYNEWQDHIQEEIWDIMSRKKLTVRSKLSGKYRMASASILFTILVGQIYTTISPFGIFYPHPRYFPVLMILLFIFSIMFFASTFRHYFFPYAHWNMRKERGSRLYERSIKEIVTLSFFLVITALVMTLVFDSSIPF